MLHRVKKAKVPKNQIRLSQAESQINDIIILFIENNKSNITII